MLLLVFYLLLIFGKLFVELLILIRLLLEIVLHLLCFLILRLDLTLKLLDFFLKLLIILGVDGSFALVLILERFEPENFFFLVPQLFLGASELSFSIDGTC